MNEITARNSTQASSQNRELPADRYVLLSEAVHELVVLANPGTAGLAMVSLLKKRPPSSILYDSASHIDSVYGPRAEIFREALQAEAIAEKRLLGWLEAHKIEGRATDESGVRCTVTDEDWLTCHINIAKNQLLAPLSIPNYRSLVSVRVNLRDVLESAQREGLFDGYDEIDVYSLPSPPVPPLKTLSMAQDGAKKSSEKRQKLACDRRQWIEGIVVDLMEANPAASKNYPPYWRAWLGPSRSEK